MTAASLAGLRRYRPAAVAAAALFAAGALASCGGDNAAADATVVEVTLDNYTIEPAVLTVPAGELELRVTNVDPSLVHNLTVAGKGTQPLGPGESQTLPMGEVAVGEYRMWCDVPGHAQMGQTGVMVVEPPFAAASALVPGS
jgi:plastocyanin